MIINKGAVLGGRAQVSEEEVVVAFQNGAGYSSSKLIVTSESPEATDGVIGGVKVRADGAVRVYDATTTPPDTLIKKNGYTITSEGQLCLTTGDAEAYSIGGLFVNVDGYIYCDGINSVVGQGTVEATPAGFTGYEYINTTGIVVNDFEIVETPNAVPKQLICKVRPGDISFAGGRTLTANEVDLFTDLELQFVITKANGDPVPNYFGLLHPNTGAAFNLFSDTKEGNYHGFIPVHESAGYQVTLYARGQNGSNIRVASLTKPVTTEVNTFPVRFSDSVLGSSTFDGLSPNIVSGTATYTNATKRVFGTGLFTDYDHTSATADINPLYRYNYHYFTGANEVGFPAGLYKVAAKISDDEIELEAALGADYTGVTFSTGPKDKPGTIANTQWFASGEWGVSASESVWARTVVIGYKGGFRLFHTGTGQTVLSTGFGSSGSVSAGHQFFMANGVVDGEFKNQVASGAQSSTGTGIGRHCFHNVRFTGAATGTTVSMGYSRPPNDWTRHFTFLECDIDGLTNDRFEHVSAGNLTGSSNFVVQGVVDVGVPQTGYIWYLDDGGRIQSGTNGETKHRVEYVSHANDGVNTTFTLAATVTLPRDCGSGNYCISSGSITHSWGMSATLGNPNWSLGVVFSSIKIDCLDDVRDHGIYPTNYMDNLHVCYNNFDGGIGGSYCVNGNLKSLIEGQKHYNISFCENLLTEHYRFGLDLSITSGGSEHPDEEAYGMLVRGNKSTVMHCLAYYNAARTARFAYNTSSDVRGYTQNTLWADFVRAQVKGNPASFTAVIDNNTTIDRQQVIFKNGESSLEIVDNINSHELNAYCFDIDSTGVTGGVITGNNMYNPSQPSGHVALIDDVGYTLAAFNTAVAGVNISEPLTVDTFYTDFSTDTIGSLPANTALKRNAVAGDYQVFDDAGTKVLRFQSTGTETARGLEFTALAAAGVTEIFARVKDNDTAPPSIRLVGFASDEPDNEYGAQQSSGVDTIVAYRRVSGTFTSIQQVSYVTGTTNYRNMLFRITPGTPNLIQIKVWTGDRFTDETASWTIDTTDVNRTLTDGWLGVVGFDSLAACYYECFGIGINGNAAPRS